MLDGSPQRGGDLALAIQKMELEYKMRRLSEDGIVVLGDEGEQMNDMIQRAEECQAQLRRQRLSEEVQQAGSRKRAAASASAGTNGCSTWRGRSCSTWRGRSCISWLTIEIQIQIPIQFHCGSS